MGLVPEGMNSAINSYIIITTTNLVRGFHYASMKEAEITLKGMQLCFISCLHRRTISILQLPLVITRHSSFLYPVLVGDLSSPTSKTFCVQSDLGDHGSLLDLSSAQTVLPSLLILCGDVESNPGPESKSNNIKFPYTVTY